jgi:cell division protein FtsN
MKPIKLFSVMLIVLLVYSSCDRIRYALGMPTSDQLEEARLIKEKQSVKYIQADTVKPSADSVKVAADSVIKPDTCRYYVIVGSFRVKENADAMAARMQKEGYKPAFLQFRNGLIVVSAMNVSTESEAQKIKRAITESGMDEETVWIYDKNQKLHIEK